MGKYLYSIKNLYLHLLALLFLKHFCMSRFCSQLQGCHLCFTDAESETLRCSAPASGHIASSPPWQSSLGLTLHQQLPLSNASVSVLPGRCNKMPPTGGLIHSLFLTVSESGGLRSGLGEGWFGVADLSLHPHMMEGATDLCGVSFMKH